MSNEAEDHARALLELSIALVESALDILEKHIRTDEELTKQSVLMPGGTVGKHFRHVIEMFQALLESLPEGLLLTSNPPHSTSTAVKSRSIEINYDAPLPKSRKSVAKSLPACRKAMRDVRDGLTSWRDAGESGSLSDKGLSGQMQMGVTLIAVTPTRQVMQSSVGRELWFCSLHAIHHFSMLRTMAVHELGLSLPVEFGTAPSTLLYRGPDWKPPPESREVRVRTVQSKL